MERRYAESPIHRLLGLSLRVEGEGRVVVDYDGRPEAANIHGTVAGATLSGLVDSAVMQATRTLLDPDASVATLDLKINFTRASRAGVPLSARSTVDHVGRSTAVGTARVEDPDGKLVALAVVTVSVRQARASARETA